VTRARLYDSLVLMGDPAPSLSSCTVCGSNVGPDNLIDLLGHRVCAACKPQVVQAVREGTLPSGPNAITAWRDAKKVVTHDEMTLPARCFKCNEPAIRPPIKRKLSWHNPLFYLIILPGIILHVGIIIYLIVASIFRKRATVSVHLCEKHASRRKLLLALSWISFLGGLALVGLAAALHVPWLIWPGFLCILAGLILSIRVTNLCRAAKIDGKRVWLTGAGRQFLESLYPWTGA
jgi:hypothetical protein